MRPLRSAPRSVAEIRSHFGLSGDGGDASPVPVSGVTMSSRDVQPGDLYLGVPGARFHGASFAADAIASGAVAVLTDARGAELVREAGITVPVLISSGSPRDLAGQVAAWVYRSGESSVPVFGITGTNGKTSTAYFLDSILRQLGKATGLSSTAERRIGDDAVISSLTTPEAPELHALVARMHEKPVDAIIIEVSAHALTRHRVDGLVFDIAAFTNLSHDHLDDYTDLEEYFQAKLALFQPDKARRAVVSLDTAWGERVVEGAGVPVTTISSAEDAAADWTIEVTAETPDETAFTLSHDAHGSLSTRVPVIGRHMAANGGLAIAMLVDIGFSVDEIRLALDRDGGITAVLPGRAVKIPVSLGPAVYVDSGHSPDAFAKTLESVRRVTNGRVIMVAGANGDRDSIKRPTMGREAALGSDILIITDHHPRSEDPAAIRAAVLAGAREAKPDGDIREIAEPERAIRAAVLAATPDDAILWAGLAEKPYREVGGEKIPFSVVDETVAALKERGWE